MVCYSLNIEPGSKPVKQGKRNFHPDVKAQVKEEVERLITTEFIKLIKHSSWLANCASQKEERPSSH